MNALLTCSIVDRDPANRQEMSEFLAALGVQVLGTLTRVEHLEPLLSGGGAGQLVVVNLDPNPRQTLQDIGPLMHQHPQVHFFLLSHTVDADLLMEAMHLGAREFVPLPVHEEKFRAGVERVARSVVPGKRARLIQVIPAVGGCGATTLACNIATALARNGKAALVDLDLIGGTVATAFDLRPRYTIADLADSSAKLDQQLLNNALAYHEPSGVSILPRPEMPEHAQRVGEPGFARLLAMLNQVFDYVVVDSQMSLEPLYSAVARAADMNVLVMQMNVPSARNAERFVQALMRLGVETNRIRIVANRFTKRGADLSPADIERITGMKISWLVPNDFRNANAATNFGEPLVLRVPRAEVSASLCGLAKSLNGVGAG